ncbi:maleylpyruvate isomerase family mycothiol-dependent enzyme [Micromonospora sp. DT48]|uniref:maleylpyruvate isomerase family mycothiol-dependent enzyme n=1 Tax=unclassified Micromonospora TaxID=2617518 RepID=UPI0012BBDF34|nr:maleylpyruvate isomerase family mycothiol-dependent enzyme [Micromonospora sp. CP22]MTK05261.1 maleylpyruvate isomerase family mycothiol-dependent enzyme [Micromonospora sp. CP22]
MNSADSVGPTQLTDQIIAARRQLADDLADLTEAQWAAPSLCESWSVEETLAHLTSAGCMTPFRWIRSIVAAGFRPDLHNRRRLNEQLGETPAETLAKFRAIIPSTTAPMGNPAAWLGEVVVHGQDIRRSLDLPGGPSVEAATTVARFFVAKNFAVNSRNVATGLRWEATDGPLHIGDGPIVRGTTEALVMLLAGRRAYLADVTGDGVETVNARI